MNSPALVGVDVLLSAGGGVPCTGRARQVYCTRPPRTGTRSDHHTRPHRVTFCLFRILLRFTRIHEVSACLDNLPNCTPTTQLTS